MPVGKYQHHSNQGFQKGYVPSEEHRMKLSLAKLGKKQTSDTIEKRRLKLIGHIAWNKGVKEGEGNSWKGNEVGYSGIHKWVMKHQGNAKECAYCGKEDCQGRIEWANIDHRYQRKLEDFIPLCVSCHRNYDYHLNKIN